MPDAQTAPFGTHYHPKPLDVGVAVSGPGTAVSRSFLGSELRARGVWAHYFTLSRTQQNWAVWVTVNSSHSESHAGNKKALVRVIEGENSRLNMWSDEQPKPGENNGTRGIPTRLK